MKRLKPIQTVRGIYSTGRQSRGDNPEDVMITLTFWTIDAKQHDRQRPINVGMTVNQARALITSLENMCANR